MASFVCIVKIVKVILDYNEICRLEGARLKTISSFEQARTYLVKLVQKQTRNQHKQTSLDGATAESRT
jgi:hypothetical protein